MNNKFKVSVEELVFGVEEHINIINKIEQDPEKKGLVYFVAKLLLEGYELASGIEEQLKEQPRITNEIRRYAKINEQISNILKDYRKMEKEINAKALEIRKQKN